MSLAVSLKRDAAAVSPFPSATKYRAPQLDFFDPLLRPIYPALRRFYIVQWCEQSGKKILMDLFQYSLYIYTQITNLLEAPP